MNDSNNSSVALLMRLLATDHTTAETLVRNGYESVEEVAYVPQAEFFRESGLSADNAVELRARARAYLLAR